MIRGLLLFSAILLGGCASLSSAPVLTPRPAQPELVSFAMNGRVSISHQGKKQSAGLRWIHLALSDEILLLTPLGQTAARIYSDAETATIDTDGKHFQADDVESLMQQELGWHLPLSSLHHWVLGMPADTEPAQIGRSENAQISLINQDGWEVRYLRYEETLPARMQLNHEDLQVQLLIDEWDWNP